MVSDPEAKTAPSPAHAVLAVVLQVRDGRLQVLLWQRALEPFAGTWSLPGGELAPGETLEQSIRRHLATQGRRARARPPRAARDAQRPGPQPAPLGARDGVPRPRPERPRPRAARRHALAPGRRAAARSRSTTARSCSRAASALRAKLSYTNAGFALAPETFTISELRDLYRAALGHDVSATNLQRVLLRRGAPRPDRRARASPGAAGGRPAALYRFRVARLEITDQFAVLRPPPG